MTISDNTVRVVITRIKPDTFLMSVFNGSHHVETRACSPENGWERVAAEAAGDTLH